MTLLIDAFKSPSGVGIAQDDGDLVAFTSCCLQNIVYIWADERWACKACRTSTYQSDEGESVWQNIGLHHTKASYGLHRWIANWTGYTEDQIEVTIT